jgi:4-oxalocrotonate tautomerase
MQVIERERLEKAISRKMERPMPLVRIDLQKGKDAAYRRKAGQIVYEAMVASTGVPKNDHFLIIGEHAADNFIFDPDYLGIHRTNDLIMVQIFFNEGRSVAQKQALYKAIAEGLSASLQVRPEDVFITLVEVKKENWSFGNGVAQYAA